ncbi:MAG: acyltransferase family protein [Oscillospiraceae bacterium]|nr:acyltransferase family protein [Oscillospiraceae bacterium]
MVMKQERNYGIDLLRMLAMFMVTILHVLGQGGVISRTYAGTAQHAIAWFLELAAYGAVNLYALISGYVGAQSKYRPSNLAVLWLQVFFYSFGIAAVFAIVRPDVISGSGLLEYAFPVITGKYWYFSAYVVLFLFIPLLNAAVNAASERTLRRIVVAMLLVFSLAATVARETTHDPFVLVAGYSGLWLMILYVTGAYIGKYGMWEKVPQPALLAIYLGCTVLSCLCMRFFPGAKFPASYISPLILLGSIALLLFFSRLHCGGAAKKLIALFSPAAFGVYILHVHPLIWEHLMLGRFAFIATMHPLVMGFVVLVCAFGIYLVCSLVDLLRIQLFRLLRVKKGCQALERKLFKDEEEAKIGNRS